MHRRGNNALRQLGSGSDLSESFRPLLLLGGHHFSQISCGDEHCCALEGPPDQTGGMQAFCWCVHLAVGLTAACQVPGACKGDGKTHSSG